MTGGGRKFPASVPLCPFTCQLWVTLRPNLFQGPLGAKPPRPGASPGDQGPALGSEVQPSLNTTGYQEAK